MWMDEANMAKSSQFLDLGYDKNMEYSIIVTINLLIICVKHI